MWIADRWKDYKVLDTGDGRKLEKFGKFVLDRPDPQVIWPKSLGKKEWEGCHAKYHRSTKGGGEWEIKSLPENWQIGYEMIDGCKIQFNLKPFSFKHTGIFPEQATNWDWMYGLIKNLNRDISVLNLFAYTGGATLACSAAGAKVTHIDASKGMVGWAKENAESSGLGQVGSRFLFDDCNKFIQREIRRGNKYDAIIMDPPSYGRGPKGEIWKMEEMIYDLVTTCKEVLTEKPLFFLLNSYTTGLAPSALSYMLNLAFPDATVVADEVGLPVEGSKHLILPCGASGRVLF